MTMTKVTREHYPLLTCPANVLMVPSTVRDILMVTRRGTADVIPIWPRFGRSGPNG